MHAALAPAIDRFGEMADDEQDRFLRPQALHPMELVVVGATKGRGGALEFSPGQLGCRWGGGGDFCAAFGDPVLPLLLRLLVPLGFGPGHRGHVGGLRPLGDHYLEAKARHVAPDPARRRPATQGGW